MKPQHRPISIGVFACISLCLAVPVAADDVPLAQQVEQLRRQVQALEARVRQLEQQRATAAAAAPAANPSSTPNAVPAAPVAATTSLDPALHSLGRLKEAWKGLAAGMGAAQVRDRLGAPSRVLTLGGKTIWYYTYEGVGSGSVAFSAGADKVTDWQNPPFGFW